MITGKRRLGLSMRMRILICFELWRRMGDVYDKSSLSRSRRGCSVHVPGIEVLLVASTGEDISCRCSAPDHARVYYYWARLSWLAATCCL